MSFLLSALLLATAPVEKAPPPDTCERGPRVQGRHRRPCASEGIKCDTLRCCPRLKCVEEIVGKVCRKPEPKEPGK